MYQEVLFTKFPQVAASYMIFISYQNQEIDIGILHRPYSDFTSFIYADLCVCVSV